MGKRALVTHVTESTNKDREGFVVDPFWGASTPASIAALPKLLEDAGQDRLRGALVLAVEHLGGVEVPPGDLEGVDGALVLGAVDLVAAAVRAGADEDTIVRDLAGLAIGGQMAQDVATAVSRGRGQIAGRGDEAGRGFPKLEETRWRVDVTISTTALSRVLKPTVLLQLGLSDGSVRRVEADAEKLQQLRFHAASALSSMQAMRLEGAAAQAQRRPLAGGQPRQVSGGIARNAAAVAAALGGAAPPAAAAGGGLVLPSF